MCSVIIVCSVFRKLFNFNWGMGVMGYGYGMSKKTQTVTSLICNQPLNPTKFVFSSILSLYDPLYVSWPIW